MQYVMIESEKRKQQNLLVQVWRFVILSNRFVKLLTCGDCKYPEREQGGEDLQPSADTGQPRRVV
ncbi:MAG: hypothetical protein LJE91_06610 [Gammaproteobacteria bacterium]|jgi:hypothetical protein|nr:hypothetical protein [Gammaproteobacteria bacterium]